MFIVNFKGMTMHWITKVEGFESGGNCPIDFVTLHDGRVLGINNECVVLYASMADFEAFETVDRQTIDLEHNDD